MSIFCHDKTEMSKTSQVLLESILEWFNKNEEVDNFWDKPLFLS